MTAQERTEAATPRRRQESRQKGQVAKSQDFSGTVTALGGLAILAFYGPTLYETLGSSMREHFSRIGTGDLSQAEVLALVTAAMTTTLVMLAPLMIGLVLVGTAGNVLQVGLLLSAHPLKPDLNRINPLRGLKRIFSPASLFEVAKAAAKALVIGFIAYRTLDANQGLLVSLAHTDLRTSVGILSRLGLELALMMSAAALVLAILDLGFQRFRHERQLRMTRQEVQEELKQTEGHPRLKGHFRDMRRKMAQRRMMQAVPRADVIITNPTHLAIALEYDPASMRSPRLVAKGDALMAERIREIARQHGIPLVENKPLAQALYKSVEIGMEIPAALYEAVAEVLAFVFSLKEQRRGS